MRRRLAAVWAFALLVAALPMGLPAAGDPASPLAVTVTDAPDPVASGSEILYTVTVRNTGGSKVTNVTVTDQLNGVGGIGVPPQLVLTSSQGSCTQNLTLVTCDVGSLNGGQTWTGTIRGVVTAADGTTINNTASATGTRSAQTFTSTGQATTLVSTSPSSPLADLTIAKNGPSTVPPNSPITYTLTVNNIGSANATNVRVVDPVPAAITGVSASGTSLFTCAVAGTTVSCDGGAVNAGSNATITITGTSPADGTLTNTAVVDPNDTIDEANELNNTSSAVNTTVGATPAGPLTISLTDAPDPVRPGGTLAYDILVTNTAASRADDVVITDGTQGLEAASITAAVTVTNGTTGTCTVAAPEVRCSTLRLNAGGTVAVHIEGTVVGSAGSTLIDTATVHGNVKNKGYTATATTLTTVKPDIDLTVTKADSPDPVAARSWPGAPLAGGGLTYTFVVGNSGESEATGVVLRDPLPAGTVLDSYVADAFAGCAVDAANVLLCTDGTIPANKTKTVTVVLVAPPAVGTVTNTVTVDPDNAIFEADETNNTATETTRVSTGIDLTVAKTDAAPGFDPIATSGTQTYTVTVDNLGPQDAAGITVRDTLPAGTTFLSASGDHGFTCSPAGGIVTCVGGAVRGTASETYFGNGADLATITVRVFATPAVGTMHNEVRVDPDGAIAELDETNNIDSEDTVVTNGGAALGAYNELTIAKIQTSPVPPATVATSGALEYRITVGNDASDPANGVVVHDFVPAGASYRSATGTNEFLCTYASGLVTCSGGSIPAGGSATITVTLWAPAVPGTYPNQAIVDPANTIPEGNETNNASSLTTTVDDGGLNAVYDLSIVKTGPTDATPGATLTYDLAVTNSGSLQAFNVRVRDFLPAGTTFVSARDAVSGSGAFVCSQAGGIIDCTGGSLPSGATRHITVKATAPLTRPLTITNQAIVDPDNSVAEGSEINNVSAADTLVESIVDLRVTKSGPPVANQSEVKEYKITVTNVATGAGQTASGVKVVDPLPVGVIILGIDTGTGNNFVCSESQAVINLVECLGTLTPDQEVTITIRVFITADNGTTLDNEARVDPDDTVVENNEGNNSSTVSTTIGAPDLTVDKLALDPALVPGTQATYLIAVSNVGAVDATGVVVRDTLPTALTYVSATPGASFTCSEAGGVVECSGDLPAGGTETVTLVVTVGDTGGQDVANTAVVDPNSTVTETDETNNSATATTGTDVDLVVSDIVDTPDPAAKGSVVTYTYVVTNAGAAAADGLVVRTAIPDPNGVDFVLGVASEGFACALTDGGATDTLDCTGDLAGGASTTVTVKLAATAAAPDAMTVQATADPGGAFAELDETNNTKSATTTLSGELCTLCVDLVTTVVDNPDPVTAGNPLTYTIHVTNVGDTPTASAGTGVKARIVDTLSASVGTPVINASAGFTASYDGLLHRVVLEGDLDPGETVTVTITVPTDGGLASGASIGNSVTATLTGLVSPPVTLFNTADDTASATTTVG